MNSEIIIFDKDAQALKKKRAVKYQKDHDFLYQFAQKEMQERRSFINRSFDQSSFLEDFLSKDEIVSFEPQTSDYIESILTLHNINDLPGVLAQIKTALKPDGLFLACLFGSETLYELRDCLQQAELEITGGVTPRIHPFADKQDIGALLQRIGYALPVIDSERITVTYGTLSKLMHDLRYMGESNILTNRIKHFSRRDIFTRAEALYKKLYSDPDGELEATFEIIFLLGWAPHDNQQKPLKPGSADKRMADALGSEEGKLPW